MSPWGNDHSAEGISAKSHFMETSFGPATFSLGTSGEFKLSCLLLLDGEQGNHIFSTSK